MADNHSKRLRNDAELDIELEESKRHKSYNHILSILDEDIDDEDSTEDVTPIITALQQEITSATPDRTAAVEEEEERVIRHLLEASDDELGIPNTQTHYERDFESTENGFDGSDGFSLWEFEDANANYYTLLQAQLFM